MSKILLDVIIVLVIVCIGGFFSASEMALVSLREGQVRALAKRGKRGQRTARLASDPNRFFSAVQIGVTLATLVSGAYGAATLAGFLKSWLIRQHVSDGWAATLSFVVGDRVHHVRQPGARRAGAQADRAAAGAAAGPAGRAAAGPDRDAGPAGGLAADQSRPTWSSPSWAATRASAARP